MKFKVQLEIAITNIAEIEVDANDANEAKVEAARILNGPDQPQEMTWRVKEENPLWVGVEAKPI